MSMDISMQFGITTEDFVDLTCILLTRKILENKLQMLDIKDHTFFMDTDDFIMTFDPNCAEESQMEEDDDDSERIKLIPESNVEFLDIQEVYEKVQSRAGGESLQRIAMGNITIKAISKGQISGIDVYVQRLPQAAALCGDQTKKVQLRASYEKHFKNEQTFSVNLDSVYNDSNGAPVYKLATVDIEKRNLFVLIVHVVFIGEDVKSEPFVSKPFLIRSRKSGFRKQSLET